MKCTRSNRGDHLFLKEDSDGSAVIGAVAMRLEVIAVVGFVLFGGFAACSTGQHRVGDTTNGGLPDGAALDAGAPDGSGAPR